MTMRPHPLLAAVLALSLGCSGGDDDDDDGSISFDDSGGTGTGTLKITATLSMGTAFQATVAVSDEENAAVSGASVVLTTPLEEIEMVEQVAGIGFYTLPSSGYDYATGYRLDVDAGEDYARGIAITAPAESDVTDPQGQSSLTLGNTTDVVWTGRGADAFKVEFEINEAAGSGWVDGDPGTYTTAVLNSAGLEILTFRRKKEIEITSGRTGSLLKLELKEIVSPLSVE